jgi:hypothetical protein
MRENELVLPFFKDKDTTNAVLTVLFRYNRGIAAAESIPDVAAKYNVSESDVAMYWEAVKNQDRWINE